jgi:hypothetical protein
MLLGIRFHTVAAGDSVLLGGANGQEKNWQLIYAAFVAEIINGQTWSDERDQWSWMRKFALV